MKSIIIVGGGSSGWMTASVLSKYLKTTKITLIESKHVPTLGVGESTLSHINKFLDVLDLKDEEWMPLADATYKLAINFTDFYQKGLPTSTDFVREHVPIVNGLTYKNFLLLCKMYPQEFKPIDYSKFFFDNYELNASNKFTDNQDGLFTKWLWKPGKGYHFDAYKFGTTLKELVAIPNGVEHIEDDVVDVKLTPQGSIDFLQTKNHGILKADLFVDCSGFKGFLIGETLGVEFESISNELINDSTVVAPIPYINKNNELVASTNYKALKNGWMWNTPIWSRIGTGYVYSSKFVDDETALAEFREELTKLYGEERVNNIEHRLIRFKPGVRKTPWYKNVVAIGPSSGFIEPLAATGLMLTQHSIFQLLSTLKITDNQITQVDRDAFNKNARDDFFHFKDFVVGFFTFSKRNDTAYWNHITQEISYNENNLDLYRKMVNAKTIYKMDQYELPPTWLRYYNPISDGLFESYKNKNRINFQELNDVRIRCLQRLLELKELSRRLPTHYQHLRRKIYFK